MKMARRKVLKMLYEQRMTVEEAEAMLEVLEKPIFTSVQPPKIDLTGEGEKARALMAKVLEAARTELPVFVEGEHGTGKELIARCIRERKGIGDLRPCLWGRSSLSKTVQIGSAGNRS